MAAQAWGLFLNAAGDVRPTLSITIKNAGTGTNATHWSAITGGSSATTTLLTDSTGQLTRYIDVGSYDLTVDSRTYRVEATPGVTVVDHETRIGALEVSGGAAVSAHISDSLDAHDASAISFVPGGSIAATDVQAAIAEVAAESQGVSAAIVDVKGDLIVATGADTLTRLAAGADGLAVIASSGQATGLAYAAPVPAAHTHAESEITNLVTDLAAKQLKVEAINTVATGGSAQTLPDPSTSSITDLTLTSATCTLTFPTATSGKSFLLLVRQDGTGSRTIAWPAATQWAGGSDPTLTGTASSKDMFSFTCVASIWYGFVAGQAFS